MPNFERSNGFYKPVIEFQNLEKMYSNLKKQSQKNMQILTKQMVRKVPRIVGKRASERYSLPASDFYPPNHKVKTDKKTGQKIQVKKAGWLKIKGETLDDLTFKWESRRLTVQRFKMKPAVVPEEPQKPYDITFSLLRGSRQTIQDNYTSTRFMRFFVQDLKGVVQALVAMEGERKIKGVAKTLSVPIMIDNENVKPKILEDINKELEAQIKKLR